MATRIVKNPSDKEVRNLGKVFLAVAGLLCAKLGWNAYQDEFIIRNGIPWQLYAIVVLLALGTYCLALGIKAQPVYRAWSTLGYGLSLIVPPLMLMVLYFLVLTPFSWLRRTLIRASIEPGFDSRKATYWIETKEKKSTRRRLLKPF